MNVLLENRFILCCPVDCCFFFFLLSPQSVYVSLPSCCVHSLGDLFMVFFLFFVDVYASSFLFVVCCVLCFVRWCFVLVVARCMLHCVLCAVRCMVWLVFYVSLFVSRVKCCTFRVFITALCEPCSVIACWLLSIDNCLLCFRFFLFFLLFYFYLNVWIFIRFYFILILNQLYCCWFIFAAKSFVWVQNL